jgi:hypothetical protein
MKEKLTKLFDVKSLTTLSLVFTFEFLLIFITFKTASVDNPLFTVFSNILTAVITYYFTKKKDDSKSNEGEDAK